MNHEKFIRTLLPTRGLYALFAKHKDQEFPKQTFHTTIDDLLDAVDNYEGYDLYFGIASFKEKGDRTQPNVEEIKAFFLDLDAKDFGSKKAAVVELTKFVKDTGLPIPTLIDSGRGVHAYWVLKEAISAKDWSTVARKLKELCKQKDFKADPAVTSDVARVMRIPGTFNHKEQNPLPCVVKSYDETAELITIEGFAEKLGYTFIEEPSLVVPAGFEGLTDPLADKLSGNIESSFKTIIKKTMAGKGCAQISHAIKNRATLDEPTWRGALSIAVRCVDSASAIKSVSEGHAGYSESAARKKADQTAGPYTCIELDNINPSICDKCPNKGKVKSPIVLGMQVIESEPKEDDTFTEVTKVVRDGKIQREVNAKMPRPPRGYVYGKEGGVYLVERDEDGNPDHKLITKHTLYVVDRTYDEIEGCEALIARVHLPLDGVRTFSLTNTEVAAADKLRDRLASQGVLTMNQSELKRYIMAWVDHYQQSALAKKPIRQYGWQDKDCTAFVLGDTVYTENGAELALPSPRTAPYNTYFEPRGTLTAWVENMNFWNDARFVQQQYCVGVGFGSVLMQRDNTHASMLHLYNNDSGIGKTAILKAITSAWGMPEKLIMEKEDTTASRMNRAEVWHNIPLALDEITDIDAKEAGALIYQMSSGKQRNRMNNSANEERVRGDTWSLFCVSTANSSIVEKLLGKGGKSSPEAEAQRVLEMKIGRQFSGSDIAQNEAGRQFENALDRNYGTAGPMFVQWVIKNPIETDMIIAKVREAVERRANLSISNRFWSAQVTYAIAALIICKKVGLLKYDAKLVLSFAVQKLLPSNKHHLAGLRVTGVQIVGDYLAEHFSNFLQVRDDSDVVQTGDGAVVPPDEKIRIKILGRYETDKGKLYVLCGPLREWCSTKQIDYRGLMTELKEVFPDTEIKNMRLGTGTKLNLGSSRTLVIPWTNKSDDDSQETTS